jgi:hypothetical protein
VPKVFDPKTHAVLDYLTTSAFLVMGAAFWGRHKRATAVSLINGIMVLGMSLLTDYDGDGKRPISFETHGKLDLVQAAMAGGLPSLLGFGGSAAAVPFVAQAANEIVVVSVTDFQSQGTVAGRKQMRRAA